MPLRHPLARLALCSLLPTVATGCATKNKMTAALTVPGWAVPSEQTGPNSRSEFKKGDALDLSYARWQEQVGNLTEAERTYQRVLEDDPGSLDALLGLARLEQLAGRTPAAEQAYRRAAASDPKNARAADALGQFYASERRWPEAARVLAVAAPGDDPIYRHHYAVALAHAGRPADALAQFSQGVGEAEAHYNVGQILLEEGQTAPAGREFERALALNPRLEQARTMLAELRGVPIGPQYADATAAGPVTTVAAYEPAPPVASPAAAVPPPEWQQPIRRDLTPAQLEQLRNQSASGR